MIDDGETDWKVLVIGENIFDLLEKSKYFLLFKNKSRCNRSLGG